MDALTPVELSADLPRRRPSGLVLAFLVALGLHALVLVAVLFYRLAPPAPPGEQQVSVDLAPVMAEAPALVPSEQAMSESAPPEAKPVEAPMEEALKPPPPEIGEARPDEAEPVPPPQAAIEPPPEARPIEPESQVVTSTAVEAEPLAPPPPVTARAPDPKPAEPVAQRPDPARLKAEREARLKRLREERRREEAREEAAEAREAKAREAKAREARAKAAREAKAAQARAGTAARDSAAASRQAGSGRAAAGNDPSALRQWTGAISAAIHGRMNPGAAVGTAGGTALVRFTVMRSGAVTVAGLARSSGVGPIDSAALAAVRGSLPAAPPGFVQSSLSVTIPLNFRAR